MGYQINYILTSYFVLPTFVILMFVYLTLNNNNNGKIPIPWNCHGFLNVCK